MQNRFKDAENATNSMIALFYNQQANHLSDEEIKSFERIILNAKEIIKNIETEEDFRQVVKVLNK